MKTFLVVTTIFSLLIISCSKPTQENTSSPDSTAAPSSSTSDDDPKPLALSEAGKERVADELFLAFHEGLLYDDRVVLKEEFSIEGNNFKYMMIRHNLDHAGMTSESYSGINPPTPEEEAAWDADTSRDKETLAGHGYTQITYYYTSEIDTFYIDGSYKAFADDPENPYNRLRIELDDGEGLVHKNANTVYNEKPQFSPQALYYYNPESGFSLLDEEYIYVNPAQPLTFSDQLYLKAKVKDLTDKDIAGLTKEQLSFVRNDIFAHHGHTFKTTKMITRYQNQTWYHAVVTDAASLLNKFEKRNVEFLKKNEG